MIRISNIKIGIGCESDIKASCAKKLRCPESAIGEITYVRRSLDARDKSDIHYVYTVDVSVKDEAKILARTKDRNIKKAERVEYSFAAKGKEPLKKRIVIAGFGPAGLFCAYMLSKAGYRPLVIERGADVDTRVKIVDNFWKTGELDANTSVQFGEGGAGTFSDGKLNTGVRDDFGRIRKVLETFVEFGAPEDILYSNKPHIGTDRLRSIVKGMREHIVLAGGEIRFNTRLSDIISEGGKVTAIEMVTGDEQILTQECDALVLAIGHSARDTFAMLDNRKVYLESKSFAVGVRVEHPQELINRAMYGDMADKLPPADYKLTYKANDGRGVYSFCMCPGGFVVNASSEEMRLCVNGMSNRDRSEPFANSAIVVTVGPEDFHKDGPLAGMEFQRDLEMKAYALARGLIPVQSFYDFKIRSNEERDRSGDLSEIWGFDNILKAGLDKACEDIEEIKAGNFSGIRKPHCKGWYRYSKLDTILPGFMRDDLIEAMEDFGKKIPGFDGKEALLLGIESRTSSPVRIKRNEGFESVNFENLYPCGEGAGYAGGITSAAVDGIKVFEALASRFQA
ncbi:MAG: FAD-dependent oxidoreductase [Lachnospiraceae bacterium]|nr:FAD-dependent oxidoreductase [Lachnospiraceae bacterium]